MEQVGRAPLREGGRPSSPWSRTQDVICCQSAAPHCPLPELSLSLRLHLQRSRGRALQGADSPASQEGAGGDLVLVVPRQRTERSRGAGSLPSPTPAGPGAWEECPYGSGLGTFLALLRPEKAEHFQVTDPRPQHRSATRTLRPGEEKRLARCHWGSMAGPAPVGLPQESKACGTSLGSGTL